MRVCSQHAAGTRTLYRLQSPVTSHAAARALERLGMLGYNPAGERSRACGQHVRCTVGRIWMQIIPDFGEMRGMNSKERCQSALRGAPVDRAPVFPLLMFFAADRAGITYRQFATDSHALVEAQVRIRERYGVDAVTVCSDAFRLSADLGGEMAYPQDKPPFLARPLLAGADDLARLRAVDPFRSAGRIADRCAAVSELQRAVGAECLVLGWIDMPFAEACSMCGVSQFMLLLLDDPSMAHQILEWLTELVIEFAVRQVQAGAPMAGAGDSAASLISPALYREFALPFEQRVCASIRAAGGMTKLHVCGNTSSLLPDMALAGADLYNVDHLVDFESACRVYGAAEKCFKGNLDPVADMLQASAAECQSRAFSCLRSARGLRFMLSPGCEVPAGVTDEVFSAFCESPAAFARDEMAKHH